jgi:hypothetical protein
MIMPMTDMIGIVVDTKLDDFEKIEMIYIYFE